MSLTAITTFIKIIDKNNNVIRRYQNGKQNPDNINESKISFQFPGDSSAADYIFLNFIYQGAAKNKSGDNLEAALVLANNQVSMSQAQEAVFNKYSVEVFVSKVNPSTMIPESIYGNSFLTRDNWLVTSLSYDSETVEVMLSSSIDAVGTTAPNRRLTTDIVGALPLTGDIQNR
mgnify:CR=1